MQDQITTGAAGVHVLSPSGTSLADRARELVTAAELLAASIRAFHADLRAADTEPVRQTGFRCDAAVGHATGIADDLGKTADDLVRIAQASAPGTCSIPWGVCPEHGNTLRSSAGRSWCSHPGCARQWDHSRDSLPCTEPAEWTLTDDSGASAPVCSGHASDARRGLQGARLTPLRSAGQSGTGAHR